MTKEDIKILLVDDEKQFVDTLAERLSMRGFEARVAYDGPQALKAVEQPTDVIVLDLRRPGMDGFEVLRNVKKSNPQVQVIILTGHGGGCPGGVGLFGTAGLRSDLSGCGPAGHGRRGAA